MWKTHPLNYLISTVHSNKTNAIATCGIAPLLRVAGNKIDNVIIMMI
ncbi:MAG: hypothetical protein ACLTCP_13690 [Ruminococcus bicirculans (ex Wegman et al. 2014)]